MLAVPVSAETGRGLDKLMDAVLKTHKVWNTPHLDRRGSTAGSRALLHIIRRRRWPAAASR